MKTIHSAAPAAGDPSPHDRTTPRAGFPPVFRRDLMRALRATRRDLGLSTGDLLVLDALLSFLPCRNQATGADRPVSPDMMLTVYAGNATVCDRANGMDERVLRRHLVRLETVGLVRRRLSATGKRFPLKSNGAVRDAFGVDLTLLLERNQEIAERARRAAQEREEIRSLRAEALALRGQLLGAAGHLTMKALDFVERVKTVLRRASLTLEMIRVLMEEMRAIRDGQGQVAENDFPAPHLTSPDTAGAAACSPGRENGAARRARNPDALPADNPAQDGAGEVQVSGPRSRPAPQPDRLSADNQTKNVPDRGSMTGSGPRENGSEASALSADNPSSGPSDTGGRSAVNGRYVRQVESPKIDTYQGQDLDAHVLRQAWARHGCISEFMPDAPTSPRDLLEKIYLFGGMMNLKDQDLLPALRSLGWLGTVSALDYLARKAATIVSPPAYLKRMIADHDAGKPVGWMRVAG